MSEITPTNSTPLNISGIVLNILPLRTGTSKAGNPWQVQEYILETLGTQYPRKVCFEVFGDNVNKFPMQVGQEVTVSIDVESREFNGRWYTSVRAWNVVYNGQQQGAPAPAATAQTAQPTATAPKKQAKGATPQAPADAPAAADDLPF